MIKKIVLIFGIVFMLVPISNVFAISNNGSTDLKVYVDLGYNMQITGFQLSGTGTVSSVQVYDANSVLLKTGPSTTLSNNSYKLDSAVNASAVTARYIVFNLKPKTSLNYIYTMLASSVTRDISSRQTLTSPINIYPDLTNVSVSTVSGEYIANLSWSVPNVSGLVGVKIYRGSTLIKTLDKSQTSYSDTEIGAGNYTYRVAVYYEDGTETKGTSKTITIAEKPRAPVNVSNFIASASFNVINLAWDIPNDSVYDHVVIYRRLVTEEGNQFEKILETNEVKYEDKSVSPLMEYEYRITTVSNSGLESEGVTKKVTTPEEPSPVLKDGTLQQTENGDYKYSWSEPTSGTVKIIIGGKEYAVVDAATKEIIIPKEDMKYTPIGDPNFSALPVSESGKEGEETKTPSTIEKVELPFGSKELVNVGAQLLWIIAPFVLLALSFLLVPKLRRLVVNSFRGNKGNEHIETERRTQSERFKEETAKEDSEIRERSLRQPKIRRERSIKEPRVSRISKEPRREREGRQSLREPRIPREIRKGDI